MISKHALNRLQQRGIPLVILDLLIKFGKIQYDKKGAQIYFLDREARMFVREHLNKTKQSQIDHCLNTYLVKGVNGVVFTVGHLNKRINRK